MLHRISNHVRPNPVSGRLVLALLIAVCALAVAASAYGQGNQDGRVAEDILADMARGNFDSALDKLSRNKVMIAADGDRLLFDAVTRGDKAAPVVKLLIQAGVDANRKGSNGWTPLMYAAGASSKSVNMARLLLDAGARPNAANDFGKTVLMCAVDGSCKSNDPLPLVKLLLQRGAVLRAKDKYGETTIMYAGHNVGVIKYLMSKGSTITIKADGNRDVLFGMIDSCPESLEAVKLAVSKGVDVNQVYNTGETPLSKSLLIRDKQNLKVAEYLVSKGAKVTTELIDEAYARNNTQAIEFLLSKGAKRSERMPGGKTALHYAVTLEAITPLAVSKAAVNAKDDDGRTPLHYLYFNLLFSGVDHRMGGDDPKWPDTCRKIVTLLVQKGADVNAKDKLGRTPLHYAAGVGGLGLLDPSSMQPDKNDDYAAVTAFGLGQSESVNVITQLLLDAKADPNIKDNDGRTPIYYANNTKTIRILIERGADVTVKDNDGQTPLHSWCKAMLSSEIENNPSEEDIKGDGVIQKRMIGKLLDLAISRGADVNAKDNVGKTSLDYTSTNYFMGEVLRGELTKRGAQAGSSK